MVVVVRQGHRRWLWFGVVIAVIASAVGFGPKLARSAFGSTPWPFDLRTVGVACSDDPAWVCGSIRVPLDRASPSSAVLTLRFRILPRLRSTQPSAGTLVVVNGGPGGSSMSLHSWAQKAFGPLLGNHDLLLVDNRGTGASGLINCPEVQRSYTDAAIAQCRTILGKRAGDYGTEAAVDDLEAVLEHIHARAVDLYGESYGTFFAQVFALRYPLHLQRLVLDGALPLDVDPWMRDSLPAGLAALRTTCGADPTCVASGDPIAVLAKVLAQFRIGIPPGDYSGRAFALASLLANAGHAGSAFRELPGALRAYVGGDNQPLDRLMSEAHKGSYGYGSAAASADSIGLDLAVTCSDFPQPFDQRAPLATQKRQLAATYETTAASVSHADLPFTPQETLQSPYGCLGWPAPIDARPSTLARDFPHVPTLVLEGDLDTVTPPRGARSVANEFPDSRYVQVPFVGHVTASNDKTGCAASIAVKFLAATEIDTACEKRLVAPPAVDAFPLKFSQETSITPLDHDAATGLSTNDRRMIAIARDAISDVMWRWARLKEVDGNGLRGGTFESASPIGSTDYRLDLHAIRWTTDTTVTGDLVTHPDNSMSASLDVVTPTGESELDIACPNLVGPSTVETISAYAGGHFVLRVDAKLGL
jgi:pimeloyl-ACP methyl ester carboxylesterase